MATVTIAGKQDDEQLVPAANQKTITDAVDDENGGDDTEVPEFVPTRHELLQLVKYWQQVVLDFDYFEFLTGTSWKAGFWRSLCAAQRMGRVATLLGRDVVTTAQAEVVAEFQKKKDPEEWEVFMRGPEAAWTKVQARFYAELHACEGGPGGSQSAEAGPADDWGYPAEPAHDAGDEPEARAAKPLVDLNKLDDVEE